jgi:hypothetical protein
MMAHEDARWEDELAPSVNEYARWLQKYAS